jgi:trk system potassium uptake protein
MILGSVMRRNPENPVDVDRRGGTPTGGDGGSGGGNPDGGRGGNANGGARDGDGNGGSGDQPRTVIIGCGRVGATLAGRLSDAGHDVTIIDVSSDAFNRLPEDFAGKAIRGDGTDEDVLRRAGAEGADQLYALTEGDNRNVLTAQMAAETLGVRNVVAKVNDPVRAEAYAALGIATVCRTSMVVEAIATYVGLSSNVEALGVIRATGHHHGEDTDADDHDGQDVGSRPAPALGR